MEFQAIWRSLITDWGLVLNQCPSAQQLHCPGPAPELCWEGWDSERGFCSPGDSCAPLMMSIAGSPWLIAAQSSASFPASIPHYPAAGWGPGPATPACTPCHGSQTMSHCCAWDHPQQELPLAIRMGFFCFAWLFPSWRRAPAWARVSCGCFAESPKVWSAFCFSAQEGGTGKAAQVFRWLCNSSIFSFPLLLSFPFSHTPIFSHIFSSLDGMSSPVPRHVRCLRKVQKSVWKHGHLRQG